METRKTLCCHMATWPHVLPHVATWPGEDRAFLTMFTGIPVKFIGNYFEKSKKFNLKFLIKLISL